MNETDPILLSNKLDTNPGLFECSHAFCKRYKDEIMPIISEDLHYTINEKDAFEMGYALGNLAMLKMAIRQTVTLFLVFFVGIGILLIAKVN